MTQTDLDHVEVYRRGRSQLLSLLDGTDTGTAVAACPEWRVRDVVAHVTGIASDFVSGRMPDGDLSAWTAEQVSTRRARSFESVLGEWEETLSAFEAAMRGRLAAASPRFAADVVTHSFDVATALGRPVPRSGDLVDAALATFVTMLTARLDQAGRPGLVVDTGGRSFAAGTASAAATLHADPFTALRALSGRRTETEIHTLDWEGDTEAVRDLLSPFPLPERSLGE